jgi:hypothetical protein
MADSIKADLLQAGNPCEVPGRRSVACLDGARQIGKCEEKGLLFMKRRAFIQGAAGSLMAWPLASAWGQDYQQQANGSRTIIYTENEQLGALADDRRVDLLELFKDAEEFHKLGLPFPDPHSPIYDTWQRIFRPPLAFMVEPEGVSEELADYQLNPNVVPTQAPIITTRWETSGNWSGAYIEPRNDTVFSEVSAHWTIPDLSMVPKPNVTHSSSIWVGLDGQRLYFNSSLPQIGTTQAIDKNGNIDYHAWYQWWARNQTNPRPHRIKVFSISAGDEIFSHVQTVNATHVIVSIAKLNPPKQFWSRKRRAPIYLAGPYINDHPKISGATAQWVVERPTKLNTDDLIPLVDYGRVDFRRCWASVAPEPGAPAAGYQTLDGARFIRMYERRNKPARIAMISSPLRRLMTDRPEAFKVAYQVR